jgi:uncharacterized membrane protein YgcG
MDAEDASSAEMRRPPRTDPLALDDPTVERLLSGTLPAASAPPGYAGVARLLAATVAPPTPRELAAQPAVLAELRAMTRGRLAATPVRPARPRRRRAGLAALVVVGALATGGVAAATGHLPTPVREAARSVLGPGAGTPAASPSPAASAAPGTAPAGPGGSASTVAPGPRTGRAAAGPVARPALDGLCRAWQSGNGGQSGRPDATAFEALAVAAGGPDKVPAFCENLLATDATAKPPKETKDPPNDPGQDQGLGGPPATTGHGGGGSGSGNGSSGGGGEGQDSPPAASSPDRG